MSDEVILIQTRSKAFDSDSAENIDAPDPASFNRSEALGGALLTVALTPLLSPWLLLLCHGNSKHALRASYTLGIAIGFATYGLIFIILASLVTSSLQTMCVSMIYDSAMEQVDSRAKESLTTTKIAEVKELVGTVCSLCLAYVLYAFIACAALFLGVGACMCSRSRKMLKRRKVSAF
ncbi:hypothetical protein BJ741DRAFT_4982 [Chytriomyces cf. hyalinus JEL632]|nr:hypothetical protein BJ741DRAFT_4982 [Chytriomyces cf. hyalinus JEL632]